MTNLYTLGQSAVLTVTWRDDEGALIDPVGIELTLTLPDDSTVSYVYDTDVELVRVSQGVYRVVHEVDQAGTWTWRWEATGIYADAQEGVFYAGQSIAPGPGDANLEEWAAEQYLYTMLTADSEIEDLVGTRVYSGMAPQSASYPLIVYSLIEGYDHTTQGTRLMADAEYLVECVAEGAAYPWELAGHVDRVLRDSAGFVTEFTVNVDRLGGFTLPEHTQGKQYRRAGGRYLVSVRRPT